MEFAAVFLPSEVCRLVLGYLKDNGYDKSYKVFLKECPHLAEYAAMLQKGREFPLTIAGQTLLHMLENYGKSKLLSLRPDHHDQLASVWKNFDTVVAQLKCLSTSKWTPLKTHTSSLNRSRHTFYKRNVNSSRCVDPINDEGNHEQSDIAATESDSEPIIDSNVLSSSPCSVQSSHISPSPSHGPPRVKLRTSSMHDVSLNPDTATGSPAKRSLSAERPKPRQVISLINSKSSDQSSPLQGTPKHLHKAIKQPSHKSCQMILKKGVIEPSISSTTASPSMVGTHNQPTPSISSQSKLPDISTNDVVGDSKGRIVQPSGSDSQPEATPKTCKVASNLLQTPVKSAPQGDNVKDFKSPRRKCPAPKRRSTGEFQPPLLLPSNEHHNTNSNESRVSTESHGFSVLDDLINNTMLVEKLAESINKVKRPKEKSLSVAPNAVEESSIQLKESDFHADLQSTVSDMDLDSFLAQDSQLPEDAVENIIDMTSKDPAFDALFNIFKVDKHAFIEKEYGVTIPSSTSGTKVGSTEPTAQEPVEVKPLSQPFTKVTETPSFGTSSGADQVTRDNTSDKSSNQTASQNSSLAISNNKETRPVIKEVTSSAGSHESKVIELLHPGMNGQESFYERIEVVTSLSPKETPLKTGDSKASGQLTVNSSTPCALVPKPTATFTNTPVAPPSGVRILVPSTGSILTSTIGTSQSILLPTGMSLPMNTAVKLASAPPPGKIAITRQPLRSPKKPVKKTRNRRKKLKLTPGASDSDADSVCSMDSKLSDGPPVSSRTRSRSAPSKSSCGREVITVEINAGEHKSPHKVIEILDSPQKMPDAKGKNVVTEEKDPSPAAGMGPGKAITVRGTWEIRKNESSQSLSLVDAKDERRKNLGLPSKQLLESTESIKKSSLTLTKPLFGTQILRQLPSGIYTIGSVVTSAAPVLVATTSTTVSQISDISSGADNSLSQAQPSTSTSSVILPQKGEGKQHIRTLKFDPKSSATKDSIDKPNKQVPPPQKGKAVTPKIKVSSPNDLTSKSIRTKVPTGKSRRPSASAAGKTLEPGKSPGGSSQSEGSEIDIISPQATGKAIVKSLDKSGSSDGQGVVLSIPETNKVTYREPFLSMPTDLSSMFGLSNPASTSSVAEKDPTEEVGLDKSSGIPLETINLDDILEDSVVVKSANSSKKTKTVKAKSSPCKIKRTNKTGEMTPKKKNKKSKVTNEGAKILLQDTMATGSSSTFDEAASQLTVGEAKAQLLETGSSSSGGNQEAEIAQALVALASQPVIGADVVHTVSKLGKLSEAKSSTVTVLTTNESSKSDDKMDIPFVGEESMMSQCADSLMSWAVSTSNSGPVIQSESPLFKDVRRLSDQDITKIREKRERNKCMSESGTLQLMASPDSSGMNVDNLGKVNQPHLKESDLHAKSHKSVHFRNPVAGSPLQYKPEDSSDSTRMSSDGNSINNEEGKIVSSSSSDSRGPLKLLQKNPIDLCSRSLDLANLIQASANLLGKPLQNSPIKTAFVFSPQKSPAKSVFLAKFIKSGLGSGPVPRSILKSPCPKATSPRASELMSPRTQGSDDSRDSSRGLKRPCETNIEQKKKVKLDKKAKLALLAKMDVDKFLQKLPGKASTKKSDTEKVKPASKSTASELEGSNTPSDGTNETSSQKSIS